jgi:hypothetical protein
VTARQQAKPTPPPWSVPEHHDTVVLPDGRFLIAGEHVRVRGRHGVWEFLRRVVSDKGEWLDVAEASGGKNRRVVPVAVDKVTPVVSRRRAS